MNDYTAWIVTSIPLLLIGYVWMSAALSQVFRKAGEESWQGWVPVLNAIVLLRLGRMSPWLLLLALVPVLGGLALVVVFAIGNHRVGRDFGFGGGMTALAVLLPPVWASIIAWGSAQYVAIPSLSMDAAPSALGDPWPFAAAQAARQPAGAASAAPEAPQPHTPRAAPPQAHAAPRRVDAAYPTPTGVVPDRSAPVAAPASGSIPPRPPAPPVAPAPAPASAASSAPAPASTPTPASAAAAAPAAPTRPFPTPSPVPAAHATQVAPDAQITPPAAPSAPAVAPAPPLAAAAPASPDPASPSHPVTGRQPARLAPVPDQHEAAAPASAAASAPAFPPVSAAVAPGRPVWTPPSVPAEADHAAPGPASEPTVDPVAPDPGGAPTRTSTPEAPTAPATESPAPEPIAAVPAGPPAPTMPSNAAVGMPEVSEHTVDPEVEDELPAGTWEPSPDEMPVDAEAPADSVAGTDDALPTDAPVDASADALEDEPPVDDTVMLPRRARWLLTAPNGDPIPLVSEAVIIGRRPDANGEHPDAQLVPVADATRTVSKTHARLDRVLGGWTITDLSSTNGVIVVAADGQESEAPSGEPMPLEERFLLGDAELHVSRRDS